MPKVDLIRCILIIHSPFFDECRRHMHIVHSSPTWADKHIKSFPRADRLIKLFSSKLKNVHMACFRFFTLIDWLNETQCQLYSCSEEYENCIAQLTASNQRDVVLHDIEKENLKRDLDLVTADLQSAETSFKDVQRLVEEKITSYRAIKIKLLIKLWRDRWQWVHRRLSPLVLFNPSIHPSFALAQQLFLLSFLSFQEVRANKGSHFRFQAQWRLFERESARVDYQVCQVGGQISGLQEPRGKQAGRVSLLFSFFFLQKWIASIGFPFPLSWHEKEGMNLKLTFPKQPSDQKGWKLEGIRMKDIWN